jgi:urea transport system permease protein
MEPIQSVAGSVSPRSGPGAPGGWRALAMRLDASGYVGIAILAVLIVVVFPLVLDTFRLNLMG